MAQLSIIRKPWITEKATDAAEARKYVFVVTRKATKNEVKKAIQEIYKVHVASVNIMNRRAKQKGMRHLKGHVPGFKKAVVTLKEGDTINTQ
jgi:large subunit ribosomal protein L23